MAQLVVPKKLNPLDDVAQYLGIKQATQGLKAQQQQMDTAAMNAQQQQALQAIFKDPASYDPQTKQPTDDALMKANMIHPGIAAEMSKALGRDPVSMEQVKNLQSEQGLRTEQIGNLKRDDARAVQTAADALKEKYAQEAAGVEIPSSGADVINPLTGKHTHSYQVRIRDPKDGSYTTETRYTDPLYEKPDKPAAISNDFELWMKQNPNGTAEQWQALQQKNALALKAGEQKLKPVSTNPALEDVAPNLTAPAAAAAEKHQAAYSDAVQAAKNMQDMIALAKAGNKVAYAYSPVEGVLTINVGNQVKRVNMQEIEAYGGAGSALDRIKAFVGKETTGASIPDNILNDMASLHQQLAANAKGAFQQKLNGVNKIYGSKYDAATLAGEQSGPAKGDKQSHLGASYTFDGTQWVKDKK